jgi:hypothetical protein
MTAKTFRTTPIGVLNRLALLLLPGGAWASPPDYVGGEVLIRLHSVSELAQARQVAGRHG